APADAGNTGPVRCRHAPPGRYYETSRVPPGYLYMWFTQTRRRAGPRPDNRRSPADDTSEPGWMYREPMLREPMLREPTLRGSMPRGPMTAPVRTRLGRRSRAVPGCRGGRPPPPALQYRRCAA